MNDTSITTAEEKVSQKNLDITGKSNLPSQTIKNSIALNNDMIYFKNELLKEVKKIKLDLTNKFNEYTSELDEKINKISSANMQLDEKIDYVSQNFQNKLTNLFGQKNLVNFEKNLADTKDNIITNNIKLQALREELRIHKGQYEDIVRQNILYQGLIGPGCKFRNLHEYIDYLNSSINNLMTANNQKTADMKNYKTKIDNILHNVNSQISEVILGYKSFVHQNIKDFGEKIDKEFSEYGNKLFEQKTLIVQSNKDLEKQLLDFREKYNSLSQLEENINERKGKLLEDINESNSKINETLENYKNELEEIKNQQSELMKSFQELKEKLNNSNNIFNRKKNFDLMNIRKYKKIDVKIADNMNSNNNDNNDDINKGGEFNIGNKKFKNQSTETFIMNQNNEQTPQKNNITKIYLKMNKGKNARKGSGKILKSERLEKFKFLYGNESMNNENLLLNKSIDSQHTVNAENGINKNEQKFNSSIQDSSSKRIKNKNIIEKYTSNDLYNTGLFVNFNSKCEEDNYINNLKSNALCLKLLEKGVKLDKIYNEVINRNASNPSDYFFNSKIKEKIRNARQFNKEKNYFNKSFNNKKGNINYNIEKDKYSENQKGESDTAFVIKNYEQDFIHKKTQNKLKIKNLIAIE